jgi:hypothetical protein
MNANEKKAWQAALATYRVWNEAEFQARRRDAGKKSPEQKWREFCDLMEFGLSVKPEPSIHEHRQKIAMLSEYYAQLQLFEERRKHRGQ